jgi:hypothetical protein
MSFCRVDHADPMNPVSLKRFVREEPREVIGFTFIQLWATFTDF